MGHDRAGESYGLWAIMLRTWASTAGEEAVGKFLLFAAPSLAIRYRGYPMPKKEQWEDEWKVVGETVKGGQGTAREVVSLSDPSIHGVLKKLLNNKPSKN